MIQKKKKVVYERFVRRLIYKLNIMVWAFTIYIQFGSLSQHELIESFGVILDLFLYFLPQNSFRFSKLEIGYKKYGKYI